eukprot:SAG31_NODE_505_length_14757_cov_20.172943_11_plen_128_part_00
MSTSIFLTNKMGQPVLSRKHQALVKQFCKLRVQLMVHGDLPEPGTNTINAYLRYLHYLWTNQDKLTQQDEWERPYYDYLQAPLQPLQDNLVSVRCTTTSKIDCDAITSKEWYATRRTRLTRYSKKIR